MHKFLLLLFLLTTFAFALPETPYPFSSPMDSHRFKALTKEIRCVVCQNQSIADSNAPLANDLREKIYLLIEQKKSDAEIKEYLVKRYGEFILFNPRFSKNTWFLWLFPFAGLLFIFSFLVYSCRPIKQLC